MVMKKSILFISALFVILYCSCNKGDSNSKGIYLNDFEAIGHWTDGQNISRETASSGLYCTITDSTIPYSQTMKLNWNDLKITNPKSADLIAWVLVKDLKAKGKLAFSIESKGQSIIWEGAEIQKSTKEINKWTEVKFSIDLNKKIPEDALIKIYGVNDGKERIFWDDFLLRFNN